MPRLPEAWRVVKGWKRARPAGCPAGRAYKQWESQSGFPVMEIIILPVTDIYHNLSKAFFLFFDSSSLFNSKDLYCISN